MDTDLAGQASWPDHHPTFFFVKIFLFNIIAYEQNLPNVKMETSGLYGLSFCSSTLQSPVKFFLLIFLKCN